MASCVDVATIIDSLRSIFVDDGTTPRNFNFDRSPFGQVCNLPNDVIFDIPMSYNPQPVAQETRDPRTEVKQDGSATKKVFTRPAKPEGAVPISRNPPIMWHETTEGTTDTEEANTQGTGENGTTPRRGTPTMMTKGVANSRLVPPTTTTHTPRPAPARTVKTSVDIDEFFAPKAVVQATRGGASGMSSWLARQRGGATTNPFAEYLKFSAETPQAAGKQVTKLEIFFFFQGESERRRSSTIKVLGNPTIKETIGYILYEYTRQNKQPPVKPTPAAYKLFLHDECGEPFSDFPALDEKERLLKFDFDALVLCENESFRVEGAPIPVAKGDVVEVRYDICAPSEQSLAYGSTSSSPHQRLAAGSTKLPITSLDMPVRLLIEQTIKRRLLRQSCAYGLRKADTHTDTHTDIHPDTPLKDIPRPYEFILYRKHTRREAMTVTGSGAIKVFSVSATKTKLSFDIAVEPARIAIIPKKNKQLFKSLKPLVLSFDEVRCSIGSDDKTIIINDVEYETTSSTIASEIVHLIALKVRSAVPITKANDH